MKTKLFKKLLWLLALSLGLMSCKKNETPKPIDSYVPVTEGKVFLPVLTNKPNMDKVEKTEAGRNGKREKVTNNVKMYGFLCQIYEFSYTGMDVENASYILRQRDGLLLGVKFENIEEEKVAEIKALAKKNGFNDSHILAKRFSDLARDSAEGLFRLMYYTDKKDLVFWQYGKQPSAMPTLSQFPTNDFINTRLGHYYDEINNIETGQESTVVKELKAGDKVEYVLFKIKDTAEWPSDSHRGYFFNWRTEGSDGKCHGFQYIFKEPSVGYYRDDIWKEVIPTKEFLNLCKKEGYEWSECYMEKIGGEDVVLGDRFVKDPDIELVAWRKIFDYVNSGKDSFATNFGKQ